MEALFQSMAGGFGAALSPENLLLCFVGVLIGNMIGVLPGLGPTATLALLLPFTSTLPPASGLILMAGIFYGAMYGGSITSILLGLPGEAASVVTTFDGHQMAKQGRGGVALGISAIGSFVAGTVALLGLNFLAPTLGRFAVRFGPPEYAVLTALGIVMVAYMGNRSLGKGIASAAFGLLLAVIGQDPVTGEKRFTFGSIELLGGLDFVAIAMGVFGVGEILYNLERRSKGLDASTVIGRIWPSMADFLKARWAIARGSVVGFLIGILPGGGAILASVTAYTLEKRISRKPESFGKGAIEGVAAPESANNAAAGAAFIPLLTLGIPADSVMALMFGALMLNGITPGPQLISMHPELFWSVVASMYIGNVILLLLNLPLVGLFIQLLRIRSTFLMPFAILITLIGVYSISNDGFNMWIVLLFGAIGYLMRKTGFDPGPMVIAFVLGQILERSFRQSLLMSGGDLAVFALRPISGTILVLALAAAGLIVVQGRRRKRRQAAEERDLDMK